MHHLHSFAMQPPGPTCASTMRRVRAPGRRPIHNWVVILIVKEDRFAERDSVTMCMSSSDPINLSELRILAEQR